MEEKTLFNRTVGSTLLISGCCIGAGMLGLPTLSAIAGFTPTLAMFMICWAFMLCTGLLLLETNLWFVDEVNLVSMAERTLGLIGKIIAWSMFLFLFYSLLVAYVAGSGILAADLLQEISGISIPQWMGSLFCTLLLGVMLYIGTQATDQFNRLLMAGLIASYIILVFIGIPHVHVERLMHQDWSCAPLAIPAMILSFGFHNLVPSLTSYLGRDVSKLKKAIIVGSVIPLGIYLIWEAIILGLIPLDGENGFRSALNEGQIVTQVLKSAAGGLWIVEVAQAFAFFALVTSFIGVALSFIDFLADGLHIKKSKASGKALLCLLVLTPPYLFAFIYPQVFLSALNYAGGVGATILFGVLPAAMVWVGRYRKKMGQTPILPGGKYALVLIILFSVLVVCLEIAQEIQKCQGG